MTAVLREADEDDLDRIRRWRNHPSVRQVSFTTHEIGADEHRAWFAAVRADPTRRVLVYHHEGTPAGVVLFSDIDRAAGSAEWGFYLDNEGLGRSLLAAWLRLEQAAVDYSFDELGLRVVGGATLADNRQVLLLHKRFGFAETRRYVREIDGVPREVVWTELRAADRRTGRKR
ncbi:UDP-4-amino-4,6-dideoxy-N-acetyl-beta-L-altrosamine N-acetyltransferase [Amycolatopsis sp. NBC_01488]|uniref:UDP-4-amino-4, 6-dideoxy-N-acetyl-beta-L-altrosamine N-acetyltransferase n=1 Tax=Amycolatopsis sp. NBC_01488 TaxID=2903563 RepID=UPI002E2CBCB9|nr:UDP-4-amino-4,6-dideoxy-N-acetyl-beta-L-altrosamine N-acetyltransferase [Amycolatopsis sp. NBC_01488]